MKEKKAVVKNLRSGRVLRIAVNGVVKNFSKEQETTFEECRQEVWLNIKSRARFAWNFNRIPNSEVRIIPKEGYIRETKAEWSMRMGS